MTFPPGKIGDKGQRYEIQALRRETGMWEVVGWAESPDGLKEVIALDPKYALDRRVVDRRPVPADPEGPMSREDKRCK